MGGGRSDGNLDEGLWEQGLADPGPEDPAESWNKKDASGTGGEESHEGDEGHEGDERNEGEEDNEGQDGQEVDTAKKVQKRCQTTICRANLNEIEYPFKPNQCRIQSFHRPSLSCFASMTGAGADRRQGRQVSKMGSWSIGNPNLTNDSHMSHVVWIWNNA